MKCSNCGIEIGGKRFCPNCNNESSYDGATPGDFPRSNALKSVAQFIFAPRTLFVILCIVIVIAAQ